MPSPEETTATARAFLADHPDTEDALAALIERDADGDPWTFAETELDSGRFGELVSRDLARSADGGYRLRNPEAIRTAIETAADAQSSDDTSPPDPGHTRSQSAETSESNAAAALRSRLAAVADADGVTLGGLLGTLVAVAAARLVAAPAVFQDGHVVSPVNDPYFFRYWQERLAARATGPLDVGVFADMGGAAGTRPLAHAINWWVTVLAGGVEAAPAVAAWLPVATSVVLGYAVYRFTRTLTNDVRVALAAVLFYGLAPVNVVYTSVGFLDHQAHQYLWLGLLVVALTALAVDMAARVHGRPGRDDSDHTTIARAHATDPAMWAVAAGLAVTVAASAHLWGGSPLTFVPVAAVVGLRVAVDVRHDISPVLGNAPLVAGLGVGAALAFAAHRWLGWHETIAAVTPVLVAGGALVVVVAGEGWRRTALPVTGLVGLEAVVAVGGLLAVRVLRPEAVARLRTRADDLFFREGATETVSLFSPEYAVIFGPLFQLGTGFYFAIAVLAVATWAVSRRYRPGWLVLVCFAWYYLLLATIQVRFAGQLAIVMAPFAGIGLLYVLAGIDIARPVTVFERTETARQQSGLRSRLKRSNAEGSSLARNAGTDDAGGITGLTIPAGTQKRGYLVAMVAFVLVFNLVSVPGLVGQVTHDRAQFDAARTIDAHAASTDREYPADFVLSNWGDNRMHNYFVNGESRSYGYARSTHEEFLTSQDPDGWYDQFRGRVGYVVVAEQDSLSANSTYERLHAGYGVGAADTAPTGHYQLLAADGGVRTFAVVPGARLRVPGASGERVTATTTVSVGGDVRENETVQYTRGATVSEGVAVVRVAHPGEYVVGNRTVQVSEAAVLAGEAVSVPG